MIEKLFKLKEHKTDVKTEVIAGITTFMAMAYILAVNPSILSASGMDGGAVFTATALASAIACFVMAALSNLPFVLSAGMGLNAYFAYTVCGNMGYSWQIALAAVFAEGLIFIVLTLTNVREAIFNAIPSSLKVAVSVGIGLFIAFIGMQNSKLVVNSDSTLVTIFSFKGAMEDGSMSSVGVGVVLCLIGILITGWLVIKEIKGNILIGIVATWALGIICQLVGLYKPNPDLGMYSAIPSAIISAPTSLSSTFLKMDFSLITSGQVLNFFVILFAFLFVDLFDTIGTIIGCASRAKMMDKNGKLPGIKGALFADAVGTTVGACLGTSTVTTFVESSAGISEGGRTGLTSVTSGILFLLALLFSPIFLTVPSFATAPALIVVGFMMMQQVVEINWNDVLEAIPCFITIVAMPFMYSISEGIAFGIISYAILNTIAGKSQKVTPLVYVLAVVFIFKYILI